MTTNYGYARCSTDKQDPERQYRNIASACPDAKIYFDAFTGTKIEGRKNWALLMKKIRPGDTIYFDSVSRMSRNAEEGVAEYRRLYEMGVNLCFIKEPHINTSVFTEAIHTKIPLTGGDVDFILEGVNKYLMAVAERQIIIAFEESEREVLRLRQRTREGIVTARLNGKQIGRPSNARVITKKEIQCKQRIQELSKDFDGTLKDKDVMAILGISRNTFYKYKKELKYECKQEKEKKWRTENAICD